jgi:NitT/TauT family transport system ATP-binding protein
MLKIAITKDGVNPMKINELMTLDNLSVHYPLRSAVQGISMTFNHNKSYAILGPSGCGKTTLLLSMANLLPDNAIVEGNKVEAESIKKSLVIQDFGLFPWKTVLKNVLLPLQLEKSINEETIGKAMELIEKMKLTGHIDDYPSTLSGGQKQRVALARAWLSSPDLLLMDEPLSSLDAITREQLQDDILNMFKQTDMTLVTVTHSIEEAVYLAHNIIIMKDDGTIYSIFENQSFGTENSREKQLFFDECLKVRKLLNGVNL